MNDRAGAIRAIRLPLVACLAGALLVGCGSKLTRDEAAVPAAVVLTPVDRAGFDAAIEKHRGKVVLVDYWATWCLPCVEQLPHTLKLGQMLAGRGLAVVTVSCDEPNDAERIAEFLRSKNAGGATNLISQFGGSPQTMEAFEITSGAVPFYQVYDRTGKLRQTLGIDPAAKQQYTPADIDAAVEKLLAE